jgi:glycine/D-amino acid oxidase-like deaminating enzyme
MLANTNPPSNGSGHALVIGGSMAGLLAARVLSQRFGRVTIVERDSFPKGPQFRKGVPQSRHLHALMIRGRMISERLFPGLSEELEEAGAVLLDSASDFEWLTPAGFAPRFPSDLPLLMSSRLLLEWRVRERVAALPRVNFLEKTYVTGLLPTPDGKGVAAAKLRSRDAKGAARSEKPGAAACRSRRGRQRPQLERLEVARGSRLRAARGDVHKLPPGLRQPHLPASRALRRGLEGA